MFHSRSLNKHSNFEELLVKDNSVSMHGNNINILAIEMYKTANGMPPEIMAYLN